MKEVEVMLKKKGKNERFINLIKKIFNDYDINEEKCVEILKYIYK